MWLFHVGMVSAVFVFGVASIFLQGLRSCTFIYFLVKVSMPFGIWVGLRADAGATK